MDGSDVYTLHRGTRPLLMSVPHAGTALPDDQRQRYVERAFAFEDTDWHLETLFDFVRSFGASLIVPRYSRYLIDLNRPQENVPMYPGVNNTELCPTRFFTGDPLYRSGYLPDNSEIERRVQAYWRPYHDALRSELIRLRAAHGHVVLFDGHSIKSELPWLFEGRLPALNIGTADGAACDEAITERLSGLLARQTTFSHVVNGRFKGGYITRHYGRPRHGVHAVQLEMCQRCYMDETADPRGAYDEPGAASVAPLIEQMLREMLSWRP